MIAAGLAGAALLTALVVAVATAFDRQAPATEPTQSATPTEVGVRTSVAPPTDVAGVSAEDGTVAFTWTNPEPEDGDRYAWGVADVGRPGHARDDPTAAGDLHPGHHRPGVHPGRGRCARTAG